MNKKTTIWSTIYPNDSVDIFKGKKQGNILNSLGAISVLGESQTSDLAKYVLSYGKLKGYASDLKYSDYAPLQNNFSRLFQGRLNYQHSGKIILDKSTNEPKKYPSPIDLGYVIVTDKPESSKDVPTPQYFLTLKGFLLVTGYDFNSDELRSMINNASRVSMFFCIVKHVLDKESIEFVIDIFINPIRKVLLRSDIFQNGNIDFYFSNFADAISMSFSNKMKSIYKKRQDIINKKPDTYFEMKIDSKYMELHSTYTFSELLKIKKRDELHDIEDILSTFKTQGIDSVMNNVFYSTKIKEDWYESLIDHFYPTKDSKSFFLKFANVSEKHLMYKLMQSLYFSYTFFNYGLLPYKEKKLPRSKEWKEHRKYKRFGKDSLKFGSKNKVMKEYDISNLS